MGSIVKAEGGPGVSSSYLFSVGLTLKWSIFDSVDVALLRSTSLVLSSLCCVSPAYCAQIKVAGLYSEVLDIYIPITLFSRAPKYFSRRAPYRVVPVLGDDEDWRMGEAKNITHETRLEEILRQIFLTDPTMHQAASGALQTQLVRLASFWING